MMEIITSIGVEKSTADMIVDRLQEEGVLHLGYGEADIDMVVDAFAKAFLTTKTTRHDRWAAARMVKVHGRESLTVVIAALAANADKPYAPVVNNLVELEKKLQSVLRFLRKQYNGAEIIQV